MSGNNSKGPTNNKNNCTTCGSNRGYPVLMYAIPSRVICTIKSVADHRARRTVGTATDVVVIWVVLTPTATVPGGQSAVGIGELTASQALG